MVSGDNARTAQAIAGQAGICHVLADVMPEGKVAKLKELQARGLVMAMVGDGVNDSPALTQADVGIAVASGSDIAVDAAQIVLMNSDLRSVTAALRISKKTFARIRLNFLFAFGYNLAGIPVAAGLFYPAVKVALPPWLAGLAMAMSSVSIVLSSLLLRAMHTPTVLTPLGNGGGNDGGNENVGSVGRRATMMNMEYAPMSKNATQSRGGDCDGDIGGGGEGAGIVFRTSATTTLRKVSSVSSSSCSVDDEDDDRTCLISASSF
jgi:hypothetical protein